MTASDATDMLPALPTRLVGVGLGPGDPELVTLRGVRAIRAADVVFVPTRRSGEPSYALAIARDLIDEARQRVVTVPFPEEPGAEAWLGASRTIVEEMAVGGVGAFLVEGDPTLFSSFGHVAEAVASLAPHIDVEIVPGVSSVTAAAAAAGISLADYAERVAILPATYRVADLEATLRTFECVILLKVARVFREVFDLLDRLSRLDDATFVRRVGRPDQEIVFDVRALLDDPPRDYFSLLIVRRRAP